MVASRESRRNLSLICSTLTSISLGTFPSTDEEMNAVTPTTQASDATAVSAYAVPQYERTTYYNGIVGEGGHPDLLYRSDLFTNPFPEPQGRDPSLPTKSVRGVFGTSLNKIGTLSVPRSGTG